MGTLFHFFGKAIRDFCVKHFHLWFLLKIMIFGNVPFYRELTAVDTIWHEY